MTGLRRASGLLVRHARHRARVEPGSSACLPPARVLSREAGVGQVRPARPWAGDESCPSKQLGRSRRPLRSSAACQQPRGGLVQPVDWQTAACFFADYHRLPGNESASWLTTTGAPSTLPALQCARSGGRAVFLHWRNPTDWTGHEANFSTQQAQAQTRPRFPRPDGHQEWSQGAEGSPRQRPLLLVRLTRPSR